jgi:hypothetical protein
MSENWREKRTLGYKFPVPETTKEKWKYHKQQLAI